MSNIVNPQPILQQDKSSIVTTNPLIHNKQLERELQEENQATNKSNSNSIKEMSLQDINNKIASSVIGLFDDLYMKPENMTWKEYLPIILQKEERYTYIGILLIFIGVYLLLARSK
jgi:hypothetical protein